MCTIFQCMNIFIHKLQRVRSVYLLSKPSKDVYNFFIFNVQTFKKSKQFYK